MPLFLAAAVSVTVFLAIAYRLAPPCPPHHPCRFTDRHFRIIARDLMAPRVDPELYCPERWRASRNRFVGRA